MSDLVKPRACLLVFASVNLDQNVAVPRLPRTGETVLATAYHTCPGGKGANQAVAARRLGAEVDLVACVGDDANGRWLRGEMEREGLNLLGWHTVDAPTATALIWVEPAGQNMIVVASGANARMSAAHVDAAFDSGRKWDMVLVTLETPREAVLRIIEMAGRRGIPVQLDAGGDPEVMRGQSLAGLRVFTANETELESLTGRRAVDVAEAKRAARELQTGPDQMVLLKLGALGCVCTQGPMQYHAPRCEIQAIDTVAAGDAHSAGFAVALAEGMPLPQALRFANAAGALACTKRGAMPSMPLRGEVDSLIG